MGNRKIYGIIAIVCLLLALCGSFAFAAEQKYVCKVSSANTADFPPYRAFKEVIEYLKTESNGRIEMVVYPDNQLGDQLEVLEAIQMGMIQMTMPFTSDLASFDPRVQVLDLPFLFTDYPSLREALRGPLGQKLENIYEEQGFKSFGYNLGGIRSVTNSKRPIFKLEDLEGLKIRVMQNPMHIAMFKALGANPTPLSYAELYTALQQGVVDGQENGPIQIVDAKVEEVQKYYSLTNHLQSIEVILVSKVWYESLPEDLQKVFSDAMKLLEEKETEYLFDYTDECMEIIRKAGVTINDLKPEERDRFREKCMPIYDDFEKVIGKDMMDLALEAAKKN